jgi:hypothetical protein
MSRPLRLEFAGALYHVTSRGDRQEDIYDDDADRRLFLETPFVKRELMSVNPTIEAATHTA